MAEKLIELKSQSGNPWAALAQNLGNNVSQSVNAIGQARQNTLTPSDAVKFGLLKMPTTVPGGQGPISPQATPEQVYGTKRFNKAQIEALGQGASLAERMAASKEATNRALTVQGLRGDQSAVKDHTMATPEMIANYPSLKKMGFQPGDQVPNRFISEQTKPLTPKTGAGSGLAVDKFVQTEMDKANRSINPLNAMRGTALGTAGLMKTRIATARDNLNDPTMTPQQLASVGNDLAGIVQMGSPHESGINDQNYQTWYTKAKALSGRIQNKPEEAATPETVAKLKEILNGYDKVYNKLVNTNLDADKASKSAIFKKYPDFKSSYDDLEKQVRSQYPIGDKQKDDHKSSLSLEDILKKHGIE